MPKRRISRLFGSVFTRLLLTILVTGFVINLLVIGFFGFLRHKVADSYHAHLIQYINYVTQDLGVPPDQARAQAIAEKSSLAIRYTGPENSWATAGQFFSINERRSHIWHESPGIVAGVVRGGYFARVRHGDGELLFQATRGPRIAERAQKAFLILCCVFTLVLAGAYFVIRWILKPVRWLTEGVDRVGAGDLEYRVPEKRSDEFRDLAEAFNEMVARIGKALRAREQLLLDVSHELRSPLTRLKIGLEMLPAGPKKESLREDIIEMEKMVTEILEASRMQHNAGSLNRQVIDLGALVQALPADFKQRPPGIVVAGPLDAISISADREKAATALRNVIDNALKYSTDSLEPVEISLQTQSGLAQVVIRDKGSGIPAEDLPYIFEPFYRADKSRTRKTGGFGLGLAMCQTIMAAHGGSIELTSQEGRGTTAVLTFPTDV